MRRRTYFFISFFIVGLFAPLCVFGDSNNIASLVFTTNPQTVAGNTASQAITVQAENSAGTAEKVSETNDVTFTSTSATGQFLNSTGGAVSGTMSTNTSSRTFYYEDSTAGTFTLTVTIKGRTSGKQFSVTQAITITSSSGNLLSPDNSNASSTDNSSSNSNSPSNNSNEDSSDAYSSQETIYVATDNESFDLSIGRNRLVAVGEPVSFEAKIISTNPSYGGTLFHWAFGDGTEWNGISATHTYEYPGNYIVVVNASRYSDTAVAEARIKVVSPDVTISKITGDSLVLENDGGDEINLGGWVVADAVNRFTVPQDTIISPHSSITVSGKVMKTRQFSVSATLYDPSEKEIAYAPVGFVAPIALSTRANTEDTAVQTLPVPHKIFQKTAAVSSTPKVATNLASSSAAAVIYTVPRTSDGHFLSGITSWFGSLFGKK